MAKYIWTPHGWVPAARAPRPSVAPFIIRDSMDALLHPVTGQMMDSKAAFRAATRAAGCIEVGTETEALMAPPPREPAGRVGADIARAWEMVEQGYRPDPVESVADWQAETGETVRLIGEGG